MCLYICIYARARQDALRPLDRVEKPLQRPHLDLGR